MGMTQDTSFSLAATAKPYYNKGHRNQSEITQVTSNEARLQGNDQGRFK